MLVQKPGSILLCYGQILSPPAVWLNNKVSFVSLPSVCIMLEGGCALAVMPCCHWRSVRMYAQLDASSMHTSLHGQDELPLKVTGKWNVAHNVESSH